MDRKVSSSIFENTGRTDLKDLSDNACITTACFPIRWCYPSIDGPIHDQYKGFFRPDGMIPARPEDFLILTPHPLDGGELPAKFFTGRFSLGVRPITLLYTIFDKKGNSVLLSDEGPEIYSHPELGIFSELSGIRILFLPNSIDKCNFTYIV